MTALRVGVGAVCSLRHVDRELAGHNYLYNARPNAVQRACVVEAGASPEDDGLCARHPGRRRDRYTRHRRKHAQRGGGGGSNRRIGRRHAHAERHDVDHGDVVHDVRIRLLTRIDPIYR